MIIVFIISVIIFAIGLTIRVKDTDKALVRFFKILIKILFIGGGGIFLFALLRALFGGWL